MQNNKQNNDMIIGRNAVSEALKSGRAIDSLLVAKGGVNGTLLKIAAQCRASGVVVKEVDSRKLDYMCGHSNHQGVIALTAVKEYAQVEDIFERARQKNEQPFIIICDEVEDPHNLGAIIRSADAAGAHGVIVPKRRSASLSYAVGKASAGAIEYVPVARVSNLAQTIEDLKEKGVWIYGADMDGGVWCENDLTGAIAIVIGSEGKGLGRLIKEKCDFLISMPMNGNINSLNASVAAGIIMFEAVRQRMDKI